MLLPAAALSRAGICLLPVYSMLQLGALLVDYVCVSGWGAAVPRRFPPIFSWVFGSLASLYCLLGSF